MGTIVNIIIGIVLIFVFYLTVPCITVYLKNKEFAKSQRSTSTHNRSHGHSHNHTSNSSTAFQVAQQTIINGNVEQPMSPPPLPQSAPPIAHTTGKTPYRVRKTHSNRPKKYVDRWLVIKKNRRGSGRGTKNTVQLMKRLRADGSQIKHGEQGVQ